MVVSNECSSELYVEPRGTRPIARGFSVATWHALNNNVRSDKEVVGTNNPLFDEHSGEDDNPVTRKNINV